MTYVGSAKNIKYDQVLEDIMLGPVKVGVSKFVFQVRNEQFIYQTTNC